MKIFDALAAVDSYKARTDVSDEWLSKKLGSKDTIRNWRRRARKGEADGGVNSMKAALLIKALSELPGTKVHLPDGDARLVSKTLFSEAITVSVPHLLYPDAGKIMFALPLRDLPAFCISSSDIIYIDSSDAGRDGDVVITQNDALQSDSNAVLVRRRFGNALVNPTHNLPDIDLSESDYSVLGRVLGVARL